MSHRLSVLLAAGAVLGSGGVADASTSPSGSVQQPSVLHEIETQDKTIRASPVFKQLSHFTIKTPAQARSVAVKFKGLSQTLDESAALVARASTTSAQKQGQADWVAAARESAKGVDVLGAALISIANRRDAAGQSQVKKGQALIRAANVKGAKADRLLHLPNGD